MRRRGALLAAALALGAGLRVWDAFSSGVWLDELHSLAHASPPDVAGVLEHTHWDFHAPLFFVALHLVKPLFRCPETMRFVTIASGLLVVLPLLAFARRSRLGDWALPLSAALFAFLPFQIQYATELRPYAWLMLASAAACHAAFSEEGSPGFRFVLFIVAVAFGLLTHYLMAFVVVLIGAVRVIFLAPPLGRARFAIGRGPLGLGWLILAGALGACAFLPWLFDQMSWVLDQPRELAPPDLDQRTITEANLADLFQVPLKTLVPQVRSLGAPWSALAAAGLALFLAGLAIAFVAWAARAWKRDLPPPARSTALAVTFGGLALVLLPGMSIWSWARVSVRYLCIAAWLWPLVACELVAAIRSARLQRLAAALLVLGALTAGVGHAGGRTHEDVRGAVAEARRIGAELLRKDPAHPPIYTAILLQPPRFEHGTPYLAYAPELERVEPGQLPGPGEEGFARPVVLITRRYLDLDGDAVLERARKDGMRAIVRLREGRKATAKVPIDDTMTVWVFGPGAR